MQVESVDMTREEAKSKLEEAQSKDFQEAIKILVEHTPNPVPLVFQDVIKSILKKHFDRLVAFDFLKLPYYILCEADFPANRGKDVYSSLLRWKDTVTIEKSQISSLFRKIKWTSVEEFDEACYGKSDIYPAECQLSIYHNLIVQGKKRRLEAAEKPPAKKQKLNHSGARKPQLPKGLFDDESTDEEEPAQAVQIPKIDDVKKKPQKYSLSQLANFSSDEEDGHDSAPARSLKKPRIGVEAPELPPVQPPKVEFIRSELISFSTKVPPTLQQIMNNIQNIRNSLLSNRKIPQEAKQRWMTQLQTFEKDSKRKINNQICVVGNTGAGKSSLMNALLGYSALLPTSGWKACTAVVTEVHYKPGQTIEGYVELFTKKEWETEMKTLIDDLTYVDKEGRTKFYPFQEARAHKDTPQEVARMKVMAVYGKLTLKWRDDWRVTRHCGKTIKISSEDPLLFRRAIDKYVAGTELSASHSGGSYWPVVKRVVIKVSSEVLKGGTILIDLPGVRDSNAARSEIAEKIKKDCDTIVIVSPITRAVSDKTAKDLLGESFRNQLVMDGKASSTIFCATRTDDILISEAKNDHPELTNELQDLEKERKPLAEKIDTQKYVVDQYESNKTITMQKIKRQREAILDIKRVEIEFKEDDLMEDVEEESRRRSARLRARREVEYRIRSTDELSEMEQEQITAIRNKIEEYEMRVANLDISMAEPKQDLIRLGASYQRVMKKMNNRAALIRNRASKTQLQKDFNDGLKEMHLRDKFRDMDEGDRDREIQIALDKGEEVRGVKEVELPVFTVSSREFLKLAGILRNEGEAQTFTNVEDTEIPSFCKHIAELTKKRTVHSCNTIGLATFKFLKNVLAFIGDKSTSSAADRKKIIHMFEDMYEELMDDLKDRTQSALKRAQTSLDEKMKETFQSGEAEAAQKAPEQIEAYGRKKREGGLHWGTYRATVRRQGVYVSGSAGAIDMNQKLADPYNTQMLASWDRFFNRQIPKVVKRCKKDLFGELKKFHKAFSQNVGKHGVPVERIENVVGELSNHYNELETLDQTLTRTLQDLQRNISREITPAIQSEMNSGYVGAANQRGSGTHARQKAHLEQHTQKKKIDMFKQVTQTLIQQCFDVLMPGISKGLDEVVQPTLKAVRVLYSTFFKENHEKIEISEAERERLQSLLALCKDCLPEGLIAADEIKITEKKEKEKEEEKAEYHECAVCLESPPEDPVKTPCQHVFCRTCLDSWIDQSPTCPNCRADIRKGDLRATGRRNKKKKKRKSRPDTFQIEAPQREELKHDKKVICRFHTTFFGTIDQEFSINSDMRVLKQLMEGFSGKKVKLLHNNKACSDTAKLKKYCGSDADTVDFIVK